MKERFWGNMYIDDLIFIVVNKPKLEVFIEDNPTLKKLNSVDGCCLITADGLNLKHRVSLLELENPEYFYNRSLKILKMSLKNKNYKTFYRKG